jgi:hypothetical protein
MAEGDYPKNDQCDDHSVTYKAWNVGQRFQPQGLVAPELKLEVGADYVDRSVEEDQPFNIVKQTAIHNNEGYLSLRVEIVEVVHVNVDEWRHNVPNG